MTTKILLIAGPTASGKTALSVSLAKKKLGEIINADSIQVYDSLPILSARPTIEEMKGIKHKLFGCISPKDQFSVADWHKRAKEEIEETLGSRRMPILVGGTGLYFKSILEGLAPIPNIPGDIREKIRTQLENEGSLGLFKELEKADPICASKLKENDGQRIARALEVYLATNIPLSEWQKHNSPGFLEYFDKKGLVKKVIIEIPRDILYDRINLRFDEMLKRGVLDEVRAISDKNIPAEMPAMKALGIPLFLRYFRGEMSLEDAVEDAKTQTRRYAKRQITWFKNQFGDWSRLDTRDDYAFEYLMKILD
ncbi:MAG: tRNA (adenosine(37)-N6)-dimethylallyltransferase MiaA [Sphingomonadales bacterium]